MTPMIRSLILMFLASVGLMVASPVAAAPALTYYVSRSAGDDQHDGLAARWDGVHGPWKSLARASAVKVSPGDQLLLRCGDTWDETLTLQGDGTAENPVIVSSFGTGERPYIRRTLGKNEECIVLDHAAGYCVRDLEMGFALTGVHVLMDPRIKKDYHFYRFENCFFHDIENPNFPEEGAPEGWALNWDGRGVPRDISVVGCIGLRTQGFSSNGSKGNVVFDRDTISHGSVNQVFQARAVDFNITNCAFVYNYAWRFDKWGSTQVIAGELDGGPGIRYMVTHNEFGWPGDYPGSPDGCGYDFETWSNGVTFRDNFVHDSYGEGVLFMGNREQKNLIFDSNIFRNNVRFSPRWDCTINLPMSETGSGIFSHNVFYLWPGKTAFGAIGQTDSNARPTCFTYVDNDEHPTRPFVAMPLVSHIEYQKEGRIYTFACATPGATIRYTLDASLPTATSPVYSRPIVVNRSGVVNAKAFKDGCYPSYVNSLAMELREPEGRGPAAWWRLDESSGRTARDSAGANHGQIAGATRESGKLASGLEFNGKNASVAIPSGQLSAISNTFTLSFWADPAAPRAATPEVETGMGLTGTAWWRMNEGKGTELVDSTGGTAGVLTGCTWIDGRFGRALHFNGASDAVNFHGADLGTVADNFTISFWADPEATRAPTPEANAGALGTKAQRYAITAHQFSAASGGAGAGVSVGTNGVSVFELADNYMPSLLVYEHALSGWTHIVVVYRDKQPTLFIDGVLVRTGQKSSKTVHPDFHLGGSGYGWYQGKLDEVRVYPRALTDAEIRTLTTQGEAASIPWTLDKTAGTSGLPYALAPTSRGGGSDATHAGVGVAVGTNGVSVCESSNDYLPSLLVDTVPLKGWNHIAVVYRDGQPTLYLNGVFEKAGCRSEKTVHPVFNLGGGGGLGWYAGKLDNVRVYDRVLTDAEIQELAGQWPGRSKSGEAATKETSHARTRR